MPQSLPHTAAKRMDVSGDVGSTAARLETTYGAAMHMCGAAVCCGRSVQAA